MEYLKLIANQKTWYTLDGSKPVKKHAFILEKGESVVVLTDIETLRYTPKDALHIERYKLSPR